MKKPWQVLLILLLNIGFATGCVHIYHKSKLTLKNEPFDPKKIGFRIDGYYYRTMEAEGGYLDKRGYWQKLNYPFVGTQEIIFYADGYVNYWSGNPIGHPSDTLLSKEEMVEASLIRSENTMRSMPFQVFKKNPRYTIWDWGLYRQRGNDLKIQYYFNVLGNYDLINLDAKVLNDTTINIVDQCSDHLSELRYSRNDIYHFRKFAFKPDSSNYLRDHIDRFGKKK